MAWKPNPSQWQAIWWTWGIASLLWVMSTETWRMHSEAAQSAVTARLALCAVVGGALMVWKRGAK